MRDEKLRRYFKALADRTRFDVIEELGRIGESSVSDLCLNLGVTQPLMSWHVRTLRHAGIITTRRSGRQVFCSLDHQGIAAFQARFMDLVEG
jgi:ArsR family transcriptional regulator